MAPSSSNAAASSGNAGSASRDARSDVGPAKWNCTNRAESRRKPRDFPTTVTLLPTAPAMTSNAALPNGWAPVASTGAGSSFRIAPAAGPEASATLTLVAPTTGSQPFGREQKKMVGGASYTELRRSVIDRMVSAGGWVVNDRQREISGRRVFEVIAQTPAVRRKTRPSLELLLCRN